MAARARAGCGPAYRPPALAAGGRLVAHARSRRGVTTNAGHAPDPAPAVFVDELAEADWARLRDLRIATLSTDPDAFGSRLETEALVDEAEWRRRTAGNRVFVAVVEGRDVGIAALRPVEDESVLKVSWVWVAPGHRGRANGVSDALVARCLDEARAAGAERVMLRVMAPNVRAQRLYARHGFRVEPPPSAEPGAPEPRAIEMGLALPRG